MSINHATNEIFKVSKNALIKFTVAATEELDAKGVRTKLKKMNYRQIQKQLKDNNEVVKDGFTFTKAKGVTKEKMGGVMGFFRRTRHLFVYKWKMFFGGKLRIIVGSKKALATANAEIKTLTAENKAHEKTIADKDAKIKELQDELKKKPK